MKIIGFKRSNFISKDGKEILGYDVFIGKEIDEALGAGQETERVYLSEAKLEKNGIKLEAIFGREVNVFYNRFGKPEKIEVVK